MTIASRLTEFSGGSKTCGRTWLSVGYCIQTCEILGFQGEAHSLSHACFGFPRSGAILHKFAVLQPSMSTKVLDAA